MLSHSERVLLCLFFVCLSTFSGQRARAENPVTIGLEEMVVISQPEDQGDKSLRTPAKIDTGAKNSAIDKSLAEQLDLELDGARTITIKSALGREKRPVVPVRIVMGDVTLKTEVTVTDRSGLSSLALIGSDDLSGFVVDATSRRLTTPNSDSGTEVINTRVSGANGMTLLAVLPLLALLVLAFRDLFGLTTVGLFTPVLLGMAFLQAESFAVAGIFVAMILAGFFCEPVLRTLRVSRVSRLAIVLMAQIAVLFAAQKLLNSDALASWALAVPVIVTITVIEGLWDTWDRKGLPDALLTAVLTIILAAAAALVLAFEPVQVLASRYPLVVIAVSAILSLAIGRYRGLRASELWRFRQIEQEAA